MAELSLMAGKELQTETKSQKRIGVVTAVLLISFAAVVDILQAVFDLLWVGILVNRIIDFFFGTLYGIIFYMMGVFDKRIFFVFVLGFVSDMIPGVDAFPVWFADVALTVYLVNSKNKKVTGKGFLTSVLRSPQKNLFKQPEAYAIQATRGTRKKEKRRGSISSQEQLADHVSKKQELATVTMAPQLTVAEQNRADFINMRQRAADTGRDLTQNPHQSRSLPAQDTEKPEDEAVSGERKSDFEKDNSVDLRGARTKKLRVDENTLDLQTRRREAASTGTDFRQPVDGNSNQQQ